MLILVKYTLDITNKQKKQQLIIDQKPKIIIPENTSTPHPDRSVQLFIVLFNPKQISITHHMDSQIAILQREQHSPLTHHITSQSSLCGKSGTSLSLAPKKNHICILLNTPQRQAPHTNKTGPLSLLLPNNQRNAQQRAAPHWERSAAAAAMEKWCRVVVLYVVRIAYIDDGLGFGCDGAWRLATTDNNVSNNESPVITRCTRVCCVAQPSVVCGMRRGPKSATQQ